MTPAAAQPATSASAHRTRAEVHRTAPTKTARHRQIVDILRRYAVRSQVELAALLSGEGLAVTQATLSRDLVELGAVKVRHAGGGLIYAVPGEGGDRTPLAGVRQDVLDARLARLCEEHQAEHEIVMIVVLIRHTDRRVGL